MELIKFSLLAVGKFSVLAHSHGFLLYIVLSKQARLSSHHLRNGCWNHHVLNRFIALPWLPALRWNHLVKDTMLFPFIIWPTRLKAPYQATLTLPMSSMSMLTIACDHCFNFMAIIIVNKKICHMSRNIPS